jgi:4-aminobutyrate aminotransferase
VPSDGFVDAVAEATEAADVPVIADEIQSGLGRTGEMWASDHYALEPDVICSAKAGRVGATIGRDELFPDERGRISSTWGAGDLLAAIQGSFTIDAIREHDLVANAEEKGRALRERLRDQDSDAIVDVRGLGLMVGVELASKEKRDDVIEACLRRGLMTLGCGHRTVRLLPPLDVRQREIEMGAAIFAEAVDTVL